MNNSTGASTDRQGARTGNRKKAFEEGEAKSVALPVNPAGVPEALVQRPQWVVWKYERRRVGNAGWKWTKLPVNPLTGRNARSNQPDTWSTFQEALSALQNHPEVYSGIGYMFSAEDPFCGVDFDDCRDPETGVIDEWAAQLVTRFASYTEVSPSRTGLKTFVRGTKPEGRNRPGHIEMYDCGRYFAVTGQRLPETPPTVEERQAELERLQQCLNHGSGQRDDEPPTEEIQQPPHCLTDLELIEKAKHAGNGEKFSRLWSGDTSGYPSQSEADLALCCLLAFWTGRDPARIDSLFRQSGLYREKWDRADYRAKTIQMALDGRTEFYSGNGRDSGAPAPAPEPEDEHDFHRTDTGNAHRLVQRHGGDLRYCHPWGKWLVWDGRRWIPDATAAVTSRAKETIAAWFELAHKRIGLIRRKLKEFAGDEDEN
jgi:putative DNA primase/helicase